MAFGSAHGAFCDSGTALTVSVALSPGALALQLRLSDL